jgi:hypothetical protein
LNLSDSILVNLESEANIVNNFLAENKIDYKYNPTKKQPWRGGGDITFDDIYGETKTNDTTANVLKALGYGACVIGFAAIGFIFFGIGAVVTGVVGLICCLGPSVCPNIIAAANS